jgi:hypothetical protein
MKKTIRVTITKTEKAPVRVKPLTEVHLARFRGAFRARSFDQVTGATGQTSADMKAEWVLLTTSEEAREALVASEEARAKFVRGRS